MIKMNNDVEGFVVYSREYRENDAILHIITKNNEKVQCVARGIQKINSKNASACQLFTHSRFQLLQKTSTGLHTLKSAEVVQGYRHIREDLLKQTIAIYMCECVDQSEFTNDMYDLLEQSFAILEKTTQPECILSLFQSIINRMHGIEPFVDGCVKCGKQNHICAISVLDGGFICQSCFHSMKDMTYSKTRLKYFRLLCKASIDNYNILETLNGFTYDDFFELYSFFQEYAGVSIKSFRFLKSIIEIEKDR